MFFSEHSSVCCPLSSGPNVLLISPLQPEHTLLKMCTRWLNISAPADKKKITFQNRSSGVDSNITCFVLFSVLLFYWTDSRQENQITEKMKGSCWDVRDECFCFPSLVTVCPHTSFSLPQRIKHYPGLTSCVVRCIQMQPQFHVSAELASSGRLCFSALVCRYRYTGTNPTQEFSAIRALQHRSTTMFITCSGKLQIGLSIFINTTEPLGIFNAF